VTVATIAEDNGRFLFVEEEVRGARMLNQPAGHLEPGESLVEAAVRETREETGWEVKPVALVGVYQWQDPALDDGVLRVCFHAHPVRQFPDEALDRGIIRALWLEPEEAEAYPAEERSPLVQRCIQDYQAGRSYGLEVLSTLL